MPIPVLSRLSNGLARKRGNATRVYDGSSRVAYTTRDLTDAHAITRNHKTQREDQCVSASSLAPLVMTCAGNALGLSVAQPNPSVANSLVLRPRVSLRKGCDRYHRRVPIVEVS